MSLLLASKLNSTGSSLKIAKTKECSKNIKENFFNLHINYMAAFDRIKLLRLKNIYFALC